MASQFEEGSCVKAVTVCSVRWSPPVWIASCEDGSFAQSRHPTREEAIWAARQHAHKCRPSVVRIYREDGSVEIEHPYRVSAVF
ncbi:MAG: hypothetical protein DMD62_14045 [Gemmatimonadetes bacterium]|nr:MAG: hypothetical protein DMD62_14045 [Gemmatimonadota bacterium]